MERIFDAIKALLDSGGVAYEVLEHPPVYTSEEAARVRGTSLRQGAKALVFRADGRGVLLVVAGDRRVDTRGFKRLYGVRDLRMASAEEVEQMTGLTIGSVPPFGNVMGLSTYLDRSVMENERIVFNAGSHTKSIKMLSRDFLSLVQPTVGDFSR